ncbi:hypothetical protein GUITHDRAFT_140845 [Guillardia theta CCMP2712]|uniref:Protein kinase domain-containing protein n=1 Tax=Guillardia theta (strain CCMP2712) TaxID=905079 RepID=L1J3A0_GUITC|nr:hypothetical protein GUITHDRAFT_140845 [Guillardia theta CCMP2712]EKX42991.1 hypothetical protein GUITHDRAFT_140845 [Guillardia theta CCMP2712]|eukprot:XP_005829971.1 hypothetical protein GUITHDRAFT_140845 [Guillardia theta CCMP2712]
MAASFGGGWSDMATLSSWYSLSSSQPPARESPKPRRPRALKVSVGAQDPSDEDRPPVRLDDKESGSAEERGRRLAVKWMGEDLKEMKREDERRKSDKKRDSNSDGGVKRLQHKEYSEEFLQSLPLREYLMEEKPQKLGKGKQAKTVLCSVKPVNNSAVPIKVVVKEFKNLGAGTGSFSFTMSTSRSLVSTAGVIALLAYPECWGWKFFNGSDLYSSGPPKDKQLALKVWKELAEAVCFANSCEIFHCDVNPSNILLDSEQEGGDSHHSILLVDWACSRQEASLKSKVTNGKRGHYQPGEMMNGEVGNFTDVFGTASCLLWSSLGDFPEASVLGIARILEKGLEEEKGSRYSSVDEMLRAFLDLKLINEVEGRE